MNTDWTDIPDKDWKCRARLAPAELANRSSSLSAQFFASSDWWQLRCAIMAALGDHPEARDSVARALRALSALERPSQEMPGV